MIKFLELLIRRRNPLFKFDSDVTIIMLLQLIFDKLSMFIRGFLLLRFFKWSNFALIGKSVRFYNIYNIDFGKFVKIEDFVFLSALGKGKLKLGNNVGIGAFSRIEISQTFNNLGSYIHINDNVGIGPYASLGGAGGLIIGKNTIVGPYFSCHPENHVFEDLKELIRLQGVTRKGIIVGENCWVGAKVTILDGVTIGDNCVIAAGSVITKSFESNVVIGGVPAKVIKIRN